MAFPAQATKRPIPVSFLNAATTIFLVVKTWNARSATATDALQKLRDATIRMELSLIPKKPTAAKI